MKKVKIDAKGLHYRILNEQIRENIIDGAEEIILDNVNGQRYIGDGLKQKNVKVHINGVPGNDLAAFMDGPTLFVNENAQDGVSNTMNSGKVIVNGDAGDVLGYGMRGGKLFVKGNVGYRVGIHMKAYQNHVPIIVVGGTAQDFFGEYMAGGILILLGLDVKSNEQICGSYIGTGIHGGTIYIRGNVEDHQLGNGTGVFSTSKDDDVLLENILSEYANDLGKNLKDILTKNFIKLVPISHRPYKKLYCNQP